MEVLLPNKITFAIWIHHPSLIIKMRFIKFNYSVDIHFIKFSVFFFSSSSGLRSFSVAFPFVLLIEVLLLQLSVSELFGLSMISLIHDLMSSNGITVCNQILLV
jgi:hypothetical protein